MSAEEKPTSKSTIKELTRVNAILADIVSPAGNSYKAISILGEGEQGMVFKVKRNSSSSESDETFYAAKEFPIRFTEDDLVIGWRGEGLIEINFSLLSKHPNVVGTHEFIMAKNNSAAFIIMEIAEMDIKRYLRKTPNLSLIQKLNLIFGAGRAINYIHRGGYVHCDIKSSNALIKGNNILISDFGLVRPKEDDSVEGCQTYMYRSPETLNAYLIRKLEAKGKSSRLRSSGIPEYKALFDPGDIERWEKNQEAGEIWSYGIFCLEIIYQKPELTWSSRINRRYGDEFDPYITFIKALCSNHNKVSETIIDIFGPLGDEDRLLLDLVCNNLLLINQDQRVVSYEEFLHQPLFRDHNFILTDLDNFVRPILPPNIFNRDIPLTVPRGRYNTEPLSLTVPSLINTAVDWILKTAKKLELPPIIVMDTIDFFIQNFFRFTSNEQTSLMLAAVTMFLMEKIYNMGLNTLSDYAKNLGHIFSKLKLEKPTSVDLVKVATAIIRVENGLLKFESTYRHLPSVQLIIKAMIIMKNSERYNELGGPSGIAKYLLETETSQELSNREHKTIAPIDVSKYTLNLEGGLEVIIRKRQSSRKTKH